jgi:hypothetical protein
MWAVWSCSHLCLRQHQSHWPIASFNLAFLYSGMNCWPQCHLSLHLNVFWMYFVQYGNKNSIFYFPIAIPNKFWDNLNFGNENYFNLNFGNKNYFNLNFGNKNYFNLNFGNKNYFNLNFGNKNYFNLNFGNGLKNI